MGSSGPSKEEQRLAFQQQAELSQQLAKQREEQKDQLDEAQKRKRSLLRNQLGGAASLIPGAGDNTGQTLGG